MKPALPDLLGIDAPIVLAPMGGAVTPEFAAAVSNAGGVGMLPLSWNSPEEVSDTVTEMKALTKAPFGINLIREWDQRERLTSALQAGAPVISLFWGDPEELVREAHDGGALVFVTVPSTEEAKRAAAAGADVIVAQGWEAGGHVAGTVTTMALVPRVVDAVAPVPVVAAGGVADARGLVAALALGAEGVSLGTRFLATPEANAHPVYKRKVLEATEEQTVHTRLFGGGWPGAPVRALGTAFVEQWLSQEGRGQEQRPDEPVIGQTRLGGQAVPVQRFSSLPPSGEATGDIESMDLLAGQGVGLVHEIKPAAEVVRELVEGARRIIEGRLAGAVGTGRI